MDVHSHPSMLPQLRCSASAPTQLERPVQVQRIDFTNENPARELVSVVRARHETDLGFRVAGTLAIAPSLMPQFAARVRWR